MYKFWAISVSLFLSVASAFAAATTWHTFTNKAGNTFEGSVIEVDEVLEEATVVVKKTGRNIKIDFSILSEQDVDYLLSWTPGSTEPDKPGTKPSADPDEEPEADLGEAVSRLYPQTQAEIKAKISEILKREPPSGIEGAQQKAVNTLNVYRYVCGVPCDATADKKMVIGAHDAAEACKENGGLSHELGRSTGKCNLTTRGDMTASVKGYIDDSGDNNREKRGHRRWCLNPPLAKTGFGSAGRSYSAMWALDRSGSKIKGNWSYPGTGFFPKDYVHGNAWSFYMPTPVPPKDKLKVEVFRLRKRPQKTFGITADIPGRIVAVNYISSFQNTINFEPDQELVRKGGVFWVRIRGGGVRESYLVELY